MILAEILQSHGGELCVLGGLLLASGFFSGSETALFSLTRAQTKGLLGSASRTKRLAGGMVRRRRRLLNTLLLGNMLVNIAFSATAAVLVMELGAAGVPAWGIVCASLAPMIAIILFGEVAPKMLAWSVAPAWSVAVAWPIAVVQLLLAPPRRLLESLLVTPLRRILAPGRAETSDLTAGELGALMDLSARRGVLEENVGSILSEIVELADLRARDVMIPRVDIVAAEVDTPRDELLEILRTSRRRNLLIYKKDLDHVLGVLPARRILLNPQADIRDLLRPVFYLPHSANLDQTLVQFRDHHETLAVAVDEYGGTAGLILLEDVLEEIVGDLPDRDPPAERLVEKRSPTVYVCSGNLPVREWAEVFGFPLTAGRVSTLAGYVASTLGRVPRKGDGVQIRNIRLTVRTVRGRRVESLRLELTEGQE